MKKDLKFGETPWDDMPREELLREVQRMYSALVSARGVLRLVRFGNENSPFWKDNDPDERGIGGGWGSGGEALFKAEQVLVPYLDEGGSDEITYRAFFRYANSLLFEGTEAWWACDTCQHFVSPGGDKEPCPICRMTDRGDHPLRPLAWDDLRSAPQENV